MKMFLKLVKYRLIAGLKHPVVLICLFSALICSVIVFVYADKTYNDSVLYPIAVVDEDDSEYSKDFINRLEENELITIKRFSQEKAVKQVSTGRVDGAFVLLEGFSDKISDGEFEDIIEFITPVVTTSAYPVSEIVSSEVITMWLDDMVSNSLAALYEDLGDEAHVEYSEIAQKLKNNEYVTGDIISIEYIGKKQTDYVIKEVEPVDRAIGIYASFVIFAVMLSGEWIFNIKKRGLQSRFISSNTSVSVVSLASQTAGILSSLLFFIPLLIFMQIYLSLQIYALIYILAGMILFLLCICSMAFTISIFCDNLTQLVVVGASASIINILLSSLAMPLPNWAGSAKTAAKILPGTYLLGCYKSQEQLLGLAAVTFVWMIIGYISIIWLKKKAASS